MKNTILFWLLLFAFKGPTQAQAIAWDYFTDSLPYINAICHNDANQLYCTAINSNRLIKLSGNGNELQNEVLEYNGIRYSISKMVMAQNPNQLVLCGYNTAGKGYVAKIDNSGVFTPLASIGQDSLSNTISDIGLAQNDVYFTGTVNVLDTNTQQYFKQSVTGKVSLSGNLQWLQYSTDNAVNVYGKQVRANPAGYWLLEHIDSLQFAKLRVRLCNGNGQEQFTKIIYSGYLDFNNTVSFSTEGQPGSSWMYGEDDTLHVGFNYRDSIFDNLLKGRVIAVNSAADIVFDKNFSQNSMFYLNSFTAQSNNVIDVSGAGLYLNTLDSVFLEYYPKLYRLNAVGDVIDSIQEATQQPIGAYNVYVPYNTYGLLTGGMINISPYRQVNDQTFQVLNSLDITNRIGLTAHIATDEYPIVAGYRAAQYKAFVSKVNSFLNVEDISDNQLLQVYPNPATGFVFINASTQQPTRYTIYDLQGKLMAEEDFVPGVAIDISALPSGFYTGYLSTASNKKAFKFVVQ